MLDGDAEAGRDFQRSLSESYSAQDLVDRMMVFHSDLGNPYTLWTAAQGVFEQGQGASSDAPGKATSAEFIYVDDETVAKSR